MTVGNRVCMCEVCTVVPLRLFVVVRYAWYCRTVWGHSGDTNPPAQVPPRPPPQSFFLFWGGTPLPADVCCSSAVACSGPGDMTATAEER